VCDLYVVPAALSGNDKEHMRAPETMTNPVSGAIEHGGMLKK
jgi:hypothetical protein